MRRMILAATVLVLGAGAWTLADTACCGGCEAMSCPRSTMAAATTQPSTRPAAQSYVCPMGCSRSDKPGKCPKCGMDMVKQAQS